MTLTINPVLEAKLLERAAAEGRDPSSLVEEILSDALNGSFDWQPDDEFRSMLERRISEIESGEVIGIPADEVFAKLQEKFG